MNADAVDDEIIIGDGSNTLSVDTSEYSADLGNDSGDNGTIGLRYDANPEQSMTLTPGGSYSWNYAIADGHGGYDQARVTIQGMGQHDPQQLPTAYVENTVVREQDGTVMVNVRLSHAHNQWIAVNWSAGNTGSDTAQNYQDWSTHWNDGYWEDEWVDTSHFEDVWYENWQNYPTWIDPVYDENNELVTDGYWEDNWIDEGWFEQEWVEDGYWDSQYIDGYYDDYQGTLFFAPGETQQQLQFEINNDGEAEIDESFTIELAGADWWWMAYYGYHTPANFISGQATILDNDRVVEPTAGDDELTIAEDEMIVNGEVTSNDVDFNGATLTYELMSGPAAGNLIFPENGTFTYIPDANAFGVETFVYRAFNGSAYSAPTVVTITIEPVNDVPTFSSGLTAWLTSQSEDDFSSTGTLVSELLNQLAATDAEADPIGIAVDGVDDSHGIWEFSLDGGSTWSAFGPIGSTSARLLSAEARLRFVPNSNWNSDTDGPTYIFFRGWDGTDGSVVGDVVDSSNWGASSAFSAEMATAFLTVDPVNDVPEHDGTITPTFDAIDEDDVSSAGTLIANLVAQLNLNDIDGDSIGAAITYVDESNGTWEYSTDGGASWTAVGYVHDAYALVLASDARLRFVPSAEWNSSIGGDVTVMFRAWDGSDGFVSGTVGIDAANNGDTSAFSEALTAYLTVNAVNDAPLLDDTQSPTLDAINEDDASNSGILVANLLSQTYPDDAEGDPIGVAITSVDQANGSWEYLLDGGGSWATVGYVDSNWALVLAADARLRFVPSANWNSDLGGNVAVTFRAWDGTDGSLSGANWVYVGTNGGSTAYSVQSVTAYLTVNAVNDAPSLDDTQSPVFGGIVEDDASNVGTSVASLLSQAFVTDADGESIGIALVYAETANGSWEYSLDGGSSWTDVGPVSVGAALLLAGTAQLRFVPTTDYNADIGGNPIVTFHGWDGSDGNPSGTSNVNVTATGGSTPFSEQSVNANIYVAPQNDDPTTVDYDLDVDGNTLFATTEDASLFGEGLLNEADDVDGDSLSTLEDGLSTALGGWVVIHTDGTFDYTPPTDFSGGADTFSYTILDGEGGSAIGYVTVHIVPSGPLALAEIDEDEANNQGTSILDLAQLASGGIAYGLALTAINTDVGSWQYSLDGGTSWSSIDDSIVAPATGESVGFAYSGGASFMLNVDGYASWGFDSALPESNLQTQLDFVFGAGNAVGGFTAEGYRLEFTGNLAGQDLNWSVSDVYSENEDLAWQTVTEASPPSALLMVADGQTRVRLVPAANYNGSIADALTIRWWNGTNGYGNGAVESDFEGDPSIGSNEQLVSLDVIAVNDAPIANAASWSVFEDGSVVVGGGYDVEGSSLAATVTSAPSHGTAVVQANGLILYTPTANYFGTDSFQYRVSDGELNSGIVTVTLNVLSVNDRPSFTAGANITVAEDSGNYSTGWATNLSAGPANEIGQAFTFQVVSYTNASLFASAPSIAANGALSFRPANDANGASTVTVRLMDNGGTANGSQNTSTTATFTINVTAVADAPRTIAGSYNADQNETKNVNATTGLRTWVSDPDGGTVSFVATNGAVATAHGQVTINADGSFVYSPTAGYTGLDAFTYTTVDSTGLTASGTINLTVVPNVVPTPQNDVVTTTKNTPVTFGESSLLTNDTDGDGDALGVVGIHGHPQHGSITWGSNGTFTYTPDSGFVGLDSFQYDVADETTEGRATIWIEVGPLVTDALNSGVPATNEDAAVTLHATRDRIGGQQVTHFRMTATHGTLTSGGSAINATTNVAYSSATAGFSFTPSAEYNGTASVTIQGGILVSGAFTPVGSPQTVALTINPIDDTPRVTAPTSMTVGTSTMTYFSGSNEISVTDVDGGTVTATISVDHGKLIKSGTTQQVDSFTISGTAAAVNNALLGSRYVAPSGYVGAVNLSVSVVDNTTAALSASATRTINVLPTVSINSPSQTEGAGNVMQFTVTLSAPSTQTVTVGWQRYDDTAKQGFDFNSPLNGTLTFAPGETSQTIQVNILDDDRYEGTERFRVHLISTTNALPSTSIGSGYINDNELAPVVSVPDVVVHENDGTATIHVLLSTPSAYGVYVTWSPADGTAVRPEDWSNGEWIPEYEQIEVYDYDEDGNIIGSHFEDGDEIGGNWEDGGSLYFAPGETDKSFTIDVSDDLIDEGEETFSVNLDYYFETFNWSGSLTTTVTIRDPNVAPVVNTVIAPPELASLDEDAEPSATGTLVSDWVSAAIAVGYLSDTDADVLGIAITGFNPDATDTAAGAWQYSLDDGANWTDVPTDATDAGAFLLAAAARLRFVPSGGSNGQATLAFRAWDGTDNLTSTARPNVSITNGGSEAYSASSGRLVVTVNPVDVAPEITLDVASIQVDEYGTFTVTGVVTDSSTNDELTVSLEWNGQLYTQTGLHSGDAFSLSVTVGDDNPTGTPMDDYPITATVTDEDGLSASVDAMVMVNDVAPTITLDSSAISVDEYGTFAVSGTVSDAAPDDTLTVSFEWNGQTYSQTDLHSGDAFSISVTVDDDDPTETPADDYPITVTVLDDDTLADSGAAATVTVNNIAPTVVPMSSISVNECDTLTVSGIVIDAGADDVLTVSFDWNGQTYSQSGLHSGDIFSIDVNVGDDDPTATPADNFPIIVVVSDDDGLSSSANATVTISNIAPTVSVSTGTVVNEGETFTISGTVSDACDTDELSVSFDWSGQTYSQSGLHSGDSFSFTLDAVDDDPTDTTSDVYVVDVTVTDDDTGSSSAASSVRVNNIAPTIVLDELPESVNEGSPVVISGTINDAGTADVIELTITVNNVIVHTGSYSPGSQFSYTVETEDDDLDSADDDDGPTGTLDIQVTARDDDRGIAETAGGSVSIQNVAPNNLSVSVTPSIDESGMVTLSGSFDDPGDDVFHLVVDWLDGSPVQRVDVDRTFSLTHVYLDDGDSPGNGTASDDYSISVSVSDDDNGYSTEEHALTTVNNLNPWFAGFLIGDDGAKFIFAPWIKDWGVYDEFTYDASWTFNDDAPVNGDTFSKFVTLHDVIYLDVTQLYDDDLGNGADGHGELHLVATATYDGTYNVNDSTGSDKTATGNVLANDVNWIYGGESEHIAGRMAHKLVHAELATQPDHGSVTLTADGEFVYVADGDHIGIDSFTYDLYDNYPGEGEGDGEHGPGYLGTAIVLVNYVPPTVDLQIDNVTEECEEGPQQFAPGALVRLNDDYSKGLLSRDPATGDPVVDAEGYTTPLPDNIAPLGLNTFDTAFARDLTPATLNISPGTYSGDFAVVLTFGSDITVWNVTGWNGTGTPQKVTSDTEISVPSSRQLYLWIEGVSRGVGSGVGSGAIQAQVRRPNAGRTFGDDTARYTIVDANVAVDGNRTGNIDFSSAEDHDFLFWYNNDRDGFDESGKLTELTGVQRPALDSGGLSISNKRDLEDLAPVHIYLDESIRELWQSFEPSTQLRLNFQLVDAGTNLPAPDAAIRLFYAPGANFANSWGYLKSQSTADDVVLLSEQFCLTVRGNSEGYLTLDARHFNTSGNGLASAVDHGYDLAFIFEAISPIVSIDQDLKLVVSLEVPTPNGGSDRLYMQDVSLHLKSIKKFYDNYTLIADESLLEQTFTSGGSASFPANFRIQHNSVSDYRTHESDDTVVYLHGWNMDPGFWKDAFAETMYKRLFWQGYTGTFIAFNWPTTWDDNGPWFGALSFLNQTYSTGEYYALRSGGALLSLLQDLRNDGKNVTVAAHSMGNVVVTEALHMYQQLHGSAPSIYPAQLIQNYVSMEGAIQAGAYGDDGHSALSLPTVPMTPNIPLTVSDYDYWRYPHDGVTGPYYMDGTKNVAAHWINMFNHADMATSVAWPYNNSRAAGPPAAVWPYFYQKQDTGPNLIGGRYGWDVYRSIATVGVWDRRLNGVSDFYELLAFASRANALPIGTRAMGDVGDHRWEDINLAFVFGAFDPADRANHSFQFHHSAVDTDRFYATFISSTGLSSSLPYFQDPGSV